MLGQHYQKQVNFIELSLSEVNVIKSTFIQEGCVAEWNLTEIMLLNGIQDKVILNGNLLNSMSHWSHAIEWNPDEFKVVLNGFVLNSMLLNVIP